MTEPSLTMDLRHGAAMTLISVPRAGDMTARIRVTSAGMS
jgi:hypothetical protein